MKNQTSPLAPRRQRDYAGVLSSILAILAGLLVGLIVLLATNPSNAFPAFSALIDGGRGQVGAVRQALRGTALEHVPTFGMVKDDHHRTRAIVDDEGGEIAINRHRNIFTFVTNIQDETHRYANDYRKRAMKKKSYAATLTAIPGVGEKTSAALLAHFKTVAAVKAASISDLEEVKGISHAKAEMLYNALRNGI